MLCATEVVAHHAVRSEENPLRTAALHIVYLRPGPVAGEVTFEATRVHQGRSLAATQVISRNAQGKLCTYATVTSHAA
jgi:acyl-coenzyme A thioesterase PaaI-like protein